jgi:N-acetylated-alpha-linked acidic dipeptidase
MQPLDGPEEWIKGLPSSDSIKGFFHSYAAESHVAGSEKDRRLAEWTRDMFVQFGVTNTSIETYWPLLNTPTSRSLTLLDDANATLFEATLKEDDDTQATPTFHGEPKKERKKYFKHRQR